MKSKQKMINFFLGIIFLSVITIAGCAASEQIAEKSGAQLWGENCVRCHNGPSPTAFSDVQWETLGMHMRVRASLTADETKKIIEFLKMAN
ncbi:MAG: cytochrome c [Bacteroidota bacterium]